MICDAGVERWGGIGVLFVLPTWSMADMAHADALKLGPPTDADRVPMLAREDYCQDRNGRLVDGEAIICAGCAQIRTAALT